MASIGRIDAKDDLFSAGAGRSLFALHTPEAAWSC
jgi:hypothetical protein